MTGMTSDRWAEIQKACMDLLRQPPPPDGISDFVVSGNETRKIVDDCVKEIRRLQMIQQRLAEYIARREGVLPQFAIVAAEAKQDEWLKEMADRKAAIMVQLTAEDCKNLYPLGASYGNQRPDGWQDMADRLNAVMARKLDCKIFHL